MSNWPNQIVPNGWEIVFHPNFKDLMDSRKDLEQILPNAEEARNKIVDEINKICSSSKPKSRGFPKAGHFRILKIKKFQSKHSFKCDHYNDFHRDKFLNLRSRLTSNSDFWNKCRSWSQRFIALEMSL